MAKAMDCKSIIRRFKSDRRLFFGGPKPTRARGTPWSRSRDIFDRPLAQRAVDFLSCCEASGSITTRRVSEGLAEDVAEVR